MSTKAMLRDKLAPAVGRVLLKHAFGVDVATVDHGMDRESLKGFRRLDRVRTEIEGLEPVRHIERLAIYGPD